VSWPSKVIKKEVPATKFFKVVLSDMGLKKVPTSPMEKNKMTLNREQVKVLASIFKNIEELLGGPQDIEFAYDSKQNLYVSKS
jgi:phosphoenolpyruvate synthase/pyruvate phosphate dikinase